MRFSEGFHCVPERENLMGGWMKVFNENHEEVLSQGHNETPQKISMETLYFEQRVGVAQTKD